MSNSGSSARVVDENLTTHPQMAHYVLRVGNLQASIDWYGAVLGMQPVHRNPMICFLTYDEEHHRMALVQADAEAGSANSQNAPGLDHVAFTLNSLEELLATYKRLRSREILPDWPVNHGLTTSLYYRDPDGHRVEFQIENYATARELQDYMRSEAFAENPIGVEFDPEKLLARYENGDPINELLQQGSAS